MARFKLSPLEELRLEKKRLREERHIAGQRLSYQLQYLSNNWGALIVKGVSSSLRTRVMDLVGSMISEPSNSHSPFFTKSPNPWLSLVVANMPLISGLVWKMAKPAVLAFLMKKATAMLFNRKKKR